MPHMDTFHMNASHIDGRVGQGEQCEINEANGNHLNLLIARAS